MSKPRGIWRSIPRELADSGQRRGENGAMRAEKEQRTGSRERGSVEIQFRECQREHDNVAVNPKHKEEKKEIFSKVNGANRRTVMMVECAQGWRERDSAP